VYIVSHDTEQINAGFLAQTLEII